jgi:hypothetical protein
MQKHTCCRVARTAATQQNINTQFLENLKICRKRNTKRRSGRKMLAIIGAVEIAWRLMLLESHDCKLNILGQSSFETEIRFFSRKWAA